MPFVADQPSEDSAWFEEENVVIRNISHRKLRNFILKIPPRGYIREGCRKRLGFDFNNTTLPFLEWLE